MNDRLDDLLSDAPSSLRSSFGLVTSSSRRTITNNSNKEKKSKSKKSLRLGGIKKKAEINKLTKSGSSVVPTKKTSKNSHDQQQQDPSSSMGNHARTVVMETFHGHIDSLDSKIESIQSATKDIEAMTERITFAVVTSKEEKVLDNRICSLVGKTNQTAQTVRTTLKLLQEETKQLHQQQQQQPQSQQGEPGNVVRVGVVLAPSDLRVCENMISLTSRKFIDELRLYQMAQKDYKEKTKNKFKRQIQIHIKSDLTDEQVDSLIQNSDIVDRDSLVRQMILENNNGDKINQQIQSIHRVVSQKHDAIIRIEQSVGIIHQMFLDFALLTEEQGMLLDRIEYQVQQANDYVQQGNEDIHESHQIQKKIFKKKLITLAIVAGVIVVVVIIVAL